MAGMRDIAIRDDQIAERIEDPVSLPTQRQLARARNAAQIGHHGAPFVAKQNIENQRRDGRDGRVNESRQLRDDREYDGVGRKGVKAMLVPERQLAHYRPASASLVSMVAARASIFDHSSFSNLPLTSLMPKWRSISSISCRISMESISKSPPSSG